MTQQVLQFFGPDVNARDAKRLGKQLSQVFALMQSGEWRTLVELSQAIGASDASVSARLRQLRGMGHAVDRRRVTGGVFAYRLRVAT
jgi:biotin operon repressor